MNPLDTQPFHWPSGNFRVAFSLYMHLQGDIVAILDSTGTAVVQYKYDAWGKPISKTGSMASTLGTVQPFRYRGYVYDEETGLFYLRSRYYKAVWCRFINADSLLSFHYTTISGSNLFVYCNDSPIQYTDIDGTEPDKGKVKASGTAYDAVFLYEITYVEGTCYDGYGNVAKFRSYVGLKPETSPEDIIVGISGVGASVAAIAINVNAETVYDFAGDGCYVGASFDVGFSVGIDGIVLGRRIKDLGDDFDGWQISVGLGVGLTWVHVGDSYTEIMLIEKEGIPVPEAEQYWTDTYPIY